MHRAITTASTATLTSLKSFLCKKVTVPNLVECAIESLHYKILENMRLQVITSGQHASELLKHPTAYLKKKSYSNVQIFNGSDNHVK